MALITHVSAGTRVVEAKYDIGDIIFNIDIYKTPLLSSLPKGKATDISPAIITDSLASVNSSNYHAQTENAPVASDTTRVKVPNHTQIVMVTMEVTDTQNAVAQYGISKEALYQEAKKAKELARDIEGILASDQAAQEPTIANGSIGKMAGMSAFIASNTTANSSFSQANFDALIAACVAAGGDPTVAYMDATNKLAAAAWVERTTVVVNAAGLETVVKNVDYYKSALGNQVNLVYHYLLPRDYASSAAHTLIIQPDLWEILELIPITRKVLPDLGSGPSVLLKGELSLLHHGEAGNAQFY